MLIVKLEPEANGALANQLISPELDSVPDGWVLIPQKLEEKALSLLPWLTLKLRGGSVTAVGDNDAARAAAAAAASDAVGLI